MNALLFVSLILATAQAEAPAGAAEKPPQLRAAPLTQAPAIDGDVLGDPVWTAVPAQDGFWQTIPDAGQPASERTELRVAFTAESLYVAVVCHDREPTGIIASGSRRDGSLDDTDSVRLVLDTFLDRENGFVFGTNPAGLEYDAQLTRGSAAAGRASSDRATRST